MCLVGIEREAGTISTNIHRIMSHGQFWFGPDVLHTTRNDFCLVEYSSHTMTGISEVYTYGAAVGGGGMGRSGDSRFGADFRYIALEELSSPKRYEIVSFLTYLTAKQPQNRYSFSTFNPSTVSSHLAVRERERERGLVVNTMRGSEKPKEADRWG